jgi:HupE / UreJ protein
VKALWAPALAMAAWVAAAPARAHEGSTSYLEIDARGQSAALAARLDVPLIDLAWSLPLDADGDGRLRWREIEAQTPAIAEFLAARLRLARAARPCPIRVGEPWLASRLGLPYLSFDVAADCAAPGRVSVASELFFDGDAYHRLLVSVRAQAGTQAATLAPHARAWTAHAADSAWRTALRFLGQGLWHVWIGYDHLVFLLLLLLPAVAWPHAPGNRWRAVALELARIVTAFTVAHSLTLGLAATGLARLRLPVSFAFGLVHGFGFANALAGLDTGGAAVLPVLAGFNAGVELANLGVIAVLLPPLAWLRRFAWYGARALPALSLASAALGAFWMLQRI